MKIISTLGTLIYEDDSETIKETVQNAIKNKIYLAHANLSCANLNYSDLSCLDLSYANLGFANLNHANLNYANLSYTNLSYANLSHSNLSYANLSYTKLLCTNMVDVKVDKKTRDSIANGRTILPEGDLIVYKKLFCGTICKLLIPKDAKRVGGVVGRKCRAEYAIILEGEGVSAFDCSVHYEPQKKMIPDSFDDNPLVECSKGIHFFITRQEAEEYTH